MGQIEVPTTRGFPPSDQDGVHIGKTAGGPRNAAIRVDHQNQYAEVPLHDFAQAERRDIAKGELGGEPLTCPDGVLEAGSPLEPERPAQERRAASHRQRQRSERRDPAPRVAFIRYEPLGLDTGMPPAEPTFSGEQEGIGEILQGSVERLAGAHKLRRRHAPRAGLDGRNGLPIPEAEQAGNVVLGQIALLP